MPGTSEQFDLWAVPLSHNEFRVEPGLQIELDGPFLEWKAGVPSHDVVTAEGWGREFELITVVLFFDM